MFKAPGDRKLSICRRDAPQEEQAFDIVDEVRQSDLRLRSRDPDGPDEQTHPILLLGEDMLDGRTGFGFGVVGAPDRFRHRAPLRLLRWTWLTKPFLSMNSSLAADLLAVSAQTLLAVLVLSRSPSRRRRPS